MKLAEALSLRKDLEKRISKLKDRLENVARIQVGDEPSDICFLLVMEDGTIRMKKDRKSSGDTNSLRRWLLICAMSSL